MERFSAARLLPLLPLGVLVILAFASGVAVEREVNSLDACTGSLYARSCLAEVQLLQVQASVWIVAAAAVVILVIIGRAASSHGRHLAPSSSAWLAYGLFLVTWGILGIFVGQGESYGRLPRGIGQTFLLTYVAASLTLFAGVLYRPRAGSAVAKAAEIVALAQGLLATILGLAWAYFLVFPPIIAT